MSPVPESYAVPAGAGEVANDYDGFAEAYAAETEASLHNGYYVRPAVLGLAGEVAGRRILDVGCGSGPLAAALRDRGATVAASTPAPGCWSWPGGGSARTRTCTWPTWPARCRSATARSTMPSRPWCCTTWKTGPARWPSCGACCGPAGG